MRRNPAVRRVRKYKVTSSALPVALESAGNSAAVPALVAAANPVYAAAAKPATVLVVASIIVTGILTPLVTAWWAKRVGADTRSDPEAKEAVEAAAALTAPSPVASSGG